MSPISPDLTRRRHDLDWLRVIAFGFLIFYHIGMFYVSWGWHVKSPHMGPWLQPIMAIINPWRLPLLFLISGVALHFVLDRVRVKDFLPRRMKQLGLPIVFGMLVVVTPQAYVELLTKGEIAPGYLEFYPRYLNLFSGFSIITPTYNHLWYVVYVLVYSLLIAALLPLLRKVGPAGERAIGWLMAGRFGWRLIGFPALVFVLFDHILAPRFPVSMMVVGDWYYHSILFSAVLIGWFIAKSTAFWGRLQQHLWPVALLSIALGLVLFIARLDWAAVRADPALFQTILALRMVFLWTAILTLLALAQRWLNRPGKALDFLNEAVFPYYVLHQTIIVVVGFWLALHGLPVWLEAGALVVATVLGCVVLTEIIKRAPVLRPFFGLKPRRLQPERDNGTVKPPATASTGP